MKVNGTDIRPIGLDQDGKRVKIIDQRLLPHQLEIVDLYNVDDVIRAIKDMYVRGAPLIGVTGAYGVYLGILNCDQPDHMIDHIENTCDRLIHARPTAVNLKWAVDKVRQTILESTSYNEAVFRAKVKAQEILEFEINNCKQIGQYGAELIQTISRQKQGKPVNILTHCNAGWLACIEYGTATAPIYTAFDMGIPVHVWVDETRPLNQGARLTAWELLQYGVPHTVIVDNTGGHLMQHGMVDMVIVGSDRSTYTGDVANKIGTYLKALAAKDNGIPFYVALPSSTFDWSISDGINEIPIELRDPHEIHYISGIDQDDNVMSVRITPKKTTAVNYAFDVTPARLVTGFITEKGVCKANEHDILRLFPQKK
ncbi:MAG: S-methyl-5-thioribose-1-phosphate isomerase [Desulfobacterales bacterium]|nr:S-methyl-5-thioribose-1-phosphate isomerase [Desulfobacterales bacterium]